MSNINPPQNEREKQDNKEVQPREADRNKEQQQDGEEQGREQRDRTVAR